MEKSRRSLVDKSQRFARRLSRVGFGTFGAAEPLGRIVRLDDSVDFALRRNILEFGEKVMWGYAATTFVMTVVIIYGLILKTRENKEERERSANAGSGADKSPGV